MRPSRGGPAAAAAASAARCASIARARASAGGGWAAAAAAAEGAVLLVLQDERTRALSCAAIGSCGLANAGEHRRVEGRGQECSGWESMRQALGSRLMGLRAHAMRGHNVCRVAVARQWVLGLLWPAQPIHAGACALSPAALAASSANTAGLQGTAGHPDRCHHHSRAPAIALPAPPSPSSGHRWHTAPQQQPQPWRPRSQCRRRCSARGSSSSSGGQPKRAQCAA